MAVLKDLDILRHEEETQLVVSSANCCIMTRILCGYGAFNMAEYLQSSTCILLFRLLVFTIRHCKSIVHGKAFHGKASVVSRINKFCRGGFKLSNLGSCRLSGAATEHARRIAETHASPMTG